MNNFNENIAKLIPINYNLYTKDRLKYKIIHNLQKEQLNINPVKQELLNVQLFLIDNALLYNSLHGNINAAELFLQKTLYSISKLNAISANVVLNQWIDNLQIIKHTSHNYILSANHKEYPLFVLKCAKYFQNCESVLNDAFITLIINYYNKSNIFVKIYGIFNNYNYHVWCSCIGKNTIYMAMENLGETFSLSSILSQTYDDNYKCFTVNDYLSVFTQIFCEFDALYKVLDYTHYDLHLNNVIFILKDYNESKKYKLKIIDNEMAHICINKQHHFGIKGFERFNIFCDKSYPMYDVYKFLLSSYSVITTADKTDNDELNNNRLNIINAIKKIYTFFEPEKDIDLRIKQYTKNNKKSVIDYYQPFNMDYSDKTYEDIITFIFANFTINNGNSISDNNCNDDNFTNNKSLTEFEKTIYLKEANIDYVLQYLYIKENLINISVFYKQNYDNLQIYLQKFNLNEHMENEYLQMEKKYIKLKLVMEEKEMVSNFLIFEDIKKYKTEIIKLINMYIKINEILNWSASICNYSNSIIKNNNNLIEIINDISKLNADCCKLLILYRNKYMNNFQFKKDKIISILNDDLKYKLTKLHRLFSQYYNGTFI